MPKKKLPQTIEECNAELERTQKQLRQYENRNKMRQLPQQYGKLFGTLYPRGCSGGIGLDAHENCNFLCQPV